MGQVISVSAPAIDLLIYGDRGRLVSNYLANQMQAIAPTFNAFTQRIHDAVAQSYNFLTDQFTQYNIQNQLTKTGLNALQNYYEALLTFESLQNATPTMQRWVMSHPGVKELYLQNNIEGYGDNYQNVFGKGIKHDDYNYRKVMDGVIEDEGDAWVYRTYLNEEFPGDIPLTTFEKQQVLDTYRTIDWLLETCEFDFTASSNEPKRINKS